MTVAAGESTVPFAFTIEDRETPADQLTLTVASSNEAVIPLSAVVIGGFGGFFAFDPTTPLGDFQHFLTLGLHALGGARLHLAQPLMENGEPGEPKLLLLQ